MHAYLAEIRIIYDQFYYEIWQSCYIGIKTTFFMIELEFNVQILDIICNIILPAILDKCVYYLFKKNRAV